MKLHFKMKASVDDYYLSILNGDTAIFDSGIGISIKMIRKEMAGYDGVEMECIYSVDVSQENYDFIDLFL